MNETNSTLFCRVNNFSRDVCDGENYTILLNQLKPDQCSRAPLQTKDLRQRAEQVFASELRRILMLIFIRYYKMLRKLAATNT